MCVFEIESKFNYNFAPQLSRLCYVMSYLVSSAFFMTHSFSLHFYFKILLFSIRLAHECMFALFLILKRDHKGISSENSTICSGNLLEFWLCCQLPHTFEAHVGGMTFLYKISIVNIVHSQTIVNHTTHHSLSPIHPFFYIILLFCQN